MAYSAKLNPFQTLFAAKFNFAFQKQSMNSMRNLPWQEAESQRVAYYYDHAAARTAKPALLMAVPAQLKENDRVEAIDLVNGTRCHVFVAQLKRAEDVMEAQLMDDAIEAVEIKLAYSDLDVIDVCAMVEEATATKKESRMKKEAPAAAPADPNETPFDVLPGEKKAEPEDVPFAETPAPDMPFNDEMTPPDFGPEASTEPDMPFDEPTGLQSTAEIVGMEEPSLAEQALAAQPSAKPAEMPAPEQPAAKEKKGKSKKEKAEQLPCTKFSGASVQQLQEEIPVRLAAANRLIQNAAIAKAGENPWQMLRNALLELDEAGNEVARIIARGDLDGQARYNPMVAIPATNIAQGLRHVARDLENGFEKPKTWDEAVKAAKPLIKGMEGMKITIHQQGIADVVKTPGPRLKTAEGQALENTEA